MTAPSWTIPSTPTPRRLLFTASAPTLFYAARKIAAGEDCRVRHDFFHSFRANWRQATLFWLGLLVLLAVGAGNLWIGLHTDSGLGNLCRGVGGVLLVLDALHLAVTRPHITVIHILLVVWLPALLFLDPNLFLFCLPLWLLAGGAASAVAVSGLLLPAQKQIESKRENGPE